jgi:hypothetical protein
MPCPMGWEPVAGSEPLALSLDDFGQLRAALVLPFERAAGAPRTNWLRDMWRG